MDNSKTSSPSSHHPHHHHHRIPYVIVILLLILCTLFVVLLSNRSFQPSSTSSSTTTSNSMNTNNKDDESASAAKIAKEEQDVVFEKPQPPTTLSATSTTSTEQPTSSSTTTTTTEQSTTNTPTTSSTVTLLSSMTSTTTTTTSTTSSSTFQNNENSTTHINSSAMMFTTTIPPATTAFKDRPDGLPPPMQPNVPAPRFGLEQRPIWHPSNITTAIPMIVKQSAKYIVDFVKYHVALGFDRIIIYENDDVPGDHEAALKEAKINPKYYKVIHFPGNNFKEPVQFLVLDDFLRRAQQNQKIDKTYEQNAFFKNITHFMHLDADEYLVLKNHSHVKEFIADYFKGHCGGISVNWRHFGSCGHKEYSKVPDPLRFICYGSPTIIPEFEPYVRDRDVLVKSMVETDVLQRTGLHNLMIYERGDVFWTCNTRGVKIPYGPIDNSKPIDVIQLNHYRAHSYEEFMMLDQRKRAGQTRAKTEARTISDSKKRFAQYDLNDFVDVTAHQFWMKNVEKRNFSNFELRNFTIIVEVFKNVTTTNATSIEIENVTKIVDYKRNVTSSL